MEENEGAGKVLEKKIPLTYDTLMFGQLTSVKHGNGKGLVGNSTSNGWEQAIS
ncbi:MAG: hypothetical protein IPG32_14300 [Saprospirales bacterium]|nr:hypothetical protein [Saprospirales bacterium]